jgi:DNA-directed RNA polymerase specialized sigma24 family protein
VAFRMLGSASEADDAVQEGCLSRTECVKVEDAVDRYLGRDLGLEPSSSA